MELTHEDVKKIIAVIDEAEHLDEIEIAYGGFRLHVRRAGSGAASPQPLRAAAAPAAGVSASAPPAGGLLPAASPAVGGIEEAVAADEVAIQAPMLGTFYRSPSPGEPPFVEVGQSVRADDTVCLIEVMKLFSSIRAGVDGVVARIPVENGSMVEYNQVLIVITPDRKG